MLHKGFHDTSITPTHTYTFTIASEHIHVYYNFILLDVLLTYVYPGPHFSYIVSIVSQPSIEVLDGSLASFVIVLTRVKPLTMLVDRVVCQVHKLLML